jgi:hypothetical protein
MYLFLQELEVGDVAAEGHDGRVVDGEHALEVRKSEKKKIYNYLPMTLTLHESGTPYVNDFGLLSFTDRVNCTLEG